MKIRLNGEEREIESGQTVAGLVRSLDLRPEQVAVELNRKLIARDERDGTTLAGGDELELVTLVGGG